MKTNINTQRGSAALWIIVAVVVVLGTGGYLYLKNSQIPSGVAPVENSVPKDKSTSANNSNTSIPQQTTTQSSPNNLSNLNCGQILPVSFLQNNFPSVQFTASSDMSGDGLSCAYIGGLDNKNNSYTFALAISANSKDTDYVSTIIESQNMVKNSGGPFLNCVIVNIGFNSAECSSASIDLKVFDTYFVTSNGKYSVTMTLLSPLSPSDQKLISEKVAKVVDSNLSSD